MQTTWFYAGFPSSYVSGVRCKKEDGNPAQNFAGYTHKITYVKDCERTNCAKCDSHKLQAMVY